MRESEGGRFELVQVLDDHVNDTSSMEHHHSKTNSLTQRLSSNLHHSPHVETFTIDNNSYHVVSKRQQGDDAVEHSFGSSCSSDVEPTETAAVIPITRSTMIYVLCAALNSCNLGYDIGVSTNVSKLIQNDIHITDAQREIWIGFINFWASKFGHVQAQFAY